MDGVEIIFLLILFSLITIAWTRKTGLFDEFVVQIKPLQRSYVEAIEKNNTFYQSLPEKSKDIFLKRVNHFIWSKTFIPRHIPAVTDEMVALISSSAIQLTFGLPKIMLKHFERILVYPDEYYSIINKQYHKGEVNPRHKAIVVSWKAFVAGYADPHDGINLGLHEMAHALKLENIIKNGEHGFFKIEDYNQWKKLAEREILKIRSGKDSIFRAYAGTDEDELFATGIELYFEQPKELNEYNPALYRALSKLLRQDTLKLVG